MANMFSGNVEREVPRDLKECYETDKVSHNLWVWSERLEKWGGIICVWLAIFGFIAIIYEGIVVADALDGVNLESVQIEYSSVFDAVINNLFKWSAYCLLEYCAYHVLALLIGSLATIVQNTKITANVALYRAAHGSNASSSTDIALHPAAHGSNASTNTEVALPPAAHNPSDSVTNSKPETKEEKPVQKNNADNDVPLERPFWKCMGCGKYISVKKSECECGFKRKYVE